MARHLITLVIILALLLLFQVVIGTDYEDEEEESPVYKNVLKRKLVTQTPTFKSIVREHSHHGSDTTERHFNHPTLGYVTPWYVASIKKLPFRFGSNFVSFYANTDDLQRNAKGYDIAKKFRCKFDMVSPTWFQLKYNGGQVGIQGAHDVDPKWVKAVQGADEEESCPNRVRRSDDGSPIARTKVVPRFLMEEWGLDAYNKLFSSDKTLMQQVVSMVVNEAVKHKFDGIVLDAGYLNARTPFREHMFAFLKLLGASLRSKSMIFILVIPPYRGGSPAEAFFHHQDFAELHEHIDYFSLMTYDFSNSQRPGPSSPLEWAAQCALSLVDQSQIGTKVMEKILMGVNLYGNDFTEPSGGGAILGDGVVKLLKSKKPIITWDTAVHEHKFSYKLNGVSHTVWFPTLYYIQQRISTAQERIGCGLSFWELGQGMDYFYDLL